MCPRKGRKNAPIIPHCLLTPKLTTPRGAKERQGRKGTPRGKGSFASLGASWRAFACACAFACPVLEFFSHRHQEEAISLLRGLFGRRESDEGTDARQLAAPLQAFVHADTWALSRSVLQEHPELLSESVDSLFNRLIEEARIQGQENAVPYLEQHRAVLRRCRKVGVEAAFAELARTPGPPADTAASSLRLLARRAMGGVYSLEKAIAGVAAPSVLDELSEEALLALDEELQGRMEDWQRVEECRVLAELGYAAAQVLPASPFLLALAGTTLADVLGRTAPVAEEEAAVLDRRVELYRKSIAAWERLGDAKQLHQAWKKLGEALLERYERQKRPEDLDEAIAAYENGSAGGGGQTGLGKALLRRFEASDYPADRERALAVLDEAVELAATEPERALARLYLANALFPPEEDDELDRAIAMLEQVHFPPGSAGWVRVQLSLGVALARRAEGQSRSADQERAIQCYAEILRLLPTEVAPDAIWVAGEWLVDLLSGRHSPGDWEQLVEIAARARVAAGYLFLERMLADHCAGGTPVAHPTPLNRVVEAQSYALTQLGQEGAAGEAIESARLREQVEHDLGDRPLDRAKDPAWREAISAAWRRVRRACGEYARADEARLQWAIARLAEARRDYYYLCQSLFPQLSWPAHGDER